MIKTLFAGSLILWSVAAASLAAPSAAAPQEASPVRIETNFVLGMNVCKFTTDDPEFSLSNKAGFHVGAFFPIYFTDWFGLQPGIAYSQKGGIYHSQIEAGDLRSMLAFSYLELPLVVKLGYLQREDAPFRVYFVGGASFGVKLGSRIALDLVNQGIETPVDEGKLDGYKSTAFDGIVGAGFDFAVRNGRLFFEGRYSQSLSTISTEGLDQRFKVLTFFLGYAF